MIAVFLSTAAAFMVFAMPAFAADWSFYGSARVSTFQTNVDNFAAEDTDNYSTALQGNSRIGAKVNVRDDLTGMFEYGTSGGGVNLRHIYGEWDFGAGKFLVGQTDGPLSWGYSNQVWDSDSNLNNQGVVDSGRTPMLRLTFGDFQIAAVETDSNDLGTGYTTETGLPAIEAFYSYSLNSMTFEFGAGYNSYDLVNAGVTYSVDSYVVAAGAKFNFGRAYLNGTVFVGENAGNLIAISVDGDNSGDDGYAVISGTRVLDNDCMGYGLVAGYVFNDMLTFESGFGYVKTDLDEAASDDTEEAYYLNATVTLAPGVFFVPEIGRIDGMETGDKETTYYGVKWQINF